MKLPEPSFAELRLSEIRLDGETQMRVELDDAYVDELAEAVDVLPEVVVFDDGKNKWLADGFQTLEARRKKKKGWARARVYAGKLRDAVAYALSANAKHGKRRTPRDLENVFRRILADEEWKNWSNVQLAELAGVCEKTVRTYRSRLSSDGPRMRTARRGEQTYTIDTAGLNKKAFDALSDEDKAKALERLDQEEPAAQPREAKAKQDKPESVRVVLELDPELADRIDTDARRERRNREGWIRAAIDERLEKKKAG